MLYQHDEIALEVHQSRAADVIVPRQEALQAPERLLQLQQKRAVLSERIVSLGLLVPHYDGEFHEFKSNSETANNSAMEKTITPQKELSH